MTTKTKRLSTGGNGVTLGDYEKCIEFCQSLGNSEQILQCMKGCAEVSLASINLELELLTKRREAPVTKTAIAVK